VVQTKALKDQCSTSPSCFLAPSSVLPPLSSSVILEVDASGSIVMIEDVLPMASVSLQLLFNLLVRSIGLLFSGIGTNADLLLNPVQPSVQALPELSDDGTRWRGRAVLEIAVLAAGQSAELVGGRALMDGDAIAVEVGLQLALAPVVEGALLGGLGGLSKIRGGTGIGASAARRGRGVRGIGGLDELFTSSSSARGNLLSGSIVGALNVVLQALVGEVIESPCVPARVGGLVRILADKSTELILLRGMRDRLQTRSASLQIEQ
jgi:hypothetical protein